MKPKPRKEAHFPGKVVPECAPKPCSRNCRLFSTMTGEKAKLGHNRDNGDSARAQNRTRSVGKDNECPAPFIEHAVLFVARAK